MAEVDEDNKPTELDADCVKSMRGGVHLSLPTEVDPVGGDVMDSVASGEKN